MKNDPYFDFFANLYIFEGACQFVGVALFFA
jgi:hypothetical protein